MRWLILSPLLILASCGAFSEPNAEETQTAVGAYLSEHYDTARLNPYRDMSVSRIGPCAITTVGRDLAYMCPVAFEGRAGAQRRAWATLKPLFPSGWRVAEFAPVEEAP